MNRENPSVSFDSEAASRLSDYVPVFSELVQPSAVSSPGVPSGVGSGTGSGSGVGTTSSAKVMTTSLSNASTGGFCLK